MRHVREILKLSLDARLSTRAIADHVRAGPTAVRDTLKRFERPGLPWPVRTEISDAQLEERLYGVSGVKPGRPKQPESAGSAIGLMQLNEYSRATSP